VTRSGGATGRSSTFNTPDKTFDCHGSNKLRTLSFNELQQSGRWQPLSDRLISAKSGRTLTILYISGMQKPSTLFFLPGALGRTEFWHPAADLLSYPAPKVHVTWPGFSGIRPDPSIRGIDDLVSRIVADIDQPSALIAQSMGGVVAMLVALQKPELVTHLVLSVTSGGMNLATLNAQDWRPAIQAGHPGLPDWFTSYHEDLTPKLSALRIPTLLLWGDADPISPVKVGQRLASLLPNVELHVFSGGDHSVGCTLAHLVAPLIDRHLSLRP